MEMSNACLPPTQPASTSVEQAHPRFPEYQKYRASMTSQLVTANSFALWLEQTEKHEKGSVSVYEVKPGARLAAGWWKNVFGPGHRPLHQFGPFQTESEATSATA